MTYQQLSGKNAGAGPFKTVNKTSAKKEWATILPQRYDKLMKSHKHDDYKLLL